MQESPSRTWTPLLVGMFMLVIGVCGYLMWQYLPAISSPPPAVSGQPPSGPGFEVRYNAIAALANRGSRRAIEHSPQAVAQGVGMLAGPGGFAPAAGIVQADDRLAILIEMLDEDRQLRNFRLKLETGQEAADELAARTTVVSALKAIAELRRRQPDLELSPLQPAIDRLARSSNPVVQQEAVRTQSLLSDASQKR